MMWVGEGSPWNAKSSSPPSVELFSGVPYLGLAILHIIAKAVSQDLRLKGVGKALTAAAV